MVWIMVLDQSWPNNPMLILVVEPCSWSCHNVEDVLLQWQTSIAEVGMPCRIDGHQSPRCWCMDTPQLVTSVTISTLIYNTYQYISMRMMPKSWQQCSYQTITSHTTFRGCHEIIKVDLEPWNHAFRGCHALSRQRALGCDHLNYLRLGTLEIRRLVEGSRRLRECVSVLLLRVPRVLCLVNGGGRTN